ncbi:MAG: hypothetical protein QXJ07_03145 [Candidatus Bathyarchaeia archaeon]
MEEKDEKSDKQSDKKLNDTQTQSKNEIQSQQPREEEQKRVQIPATPPSFGQNPYQSPIRIIFKLFKLGLHGFPNRKTFILTPTLCKAKKNLISLRHVFSFSFRRY